MSETIEAAEACRRLGIRAATLYSYVSRGLLRSEPGAGRGRRYRTEDVERLRQRHAGRRDPERAVRESLHWGTPVLDSALTLIQDGRLWYRGEDAIQLAATHSLEDVAALLWGEPLAATSPPEPALVAAGAELDLVSRLQVVLPIARAHDLAAEDPTPAARIAVASRIVRLLAATAAGSAQSGRVATALSRGWTRDEDAAPVLDLALVLSADHELNASTFAVRCAASTGAGLYDALAAGLAALRGPRHGAAVERALRLLREVERRGAREAIAAALREGQPPAGFGHPLYPGGDPRGRALVTAVAAAQPGAPGTTAMLALTEAVRQELGHEPTLDLGLAALAEACALPDGAAFAIFAIGRAVGWIAHATEQYAEGRLIRPRARYIGPPPASATARPGPRATGGQAPGVVSA